MCLCPCANGENIALFAADIYSLNAVCLFGDVAADFKRFIKAV